MQRTGGLPGRQQAAVHGLRISSLGIQQQQCGRLSASAPQVPLQRQRRPLRGSSVAGCCSSGGGAARRHRLSPQSPQQLAQRPAPPRQRAADVVRGLAAADDEGSGPSVADAASPWWQSLSSPYDSEIFLLAIPALFSVLLGARAGAGGACGRRCLPLPRPLLLGHPCRPLSLALLLLSPPPSTKSRPHHGHGLNRHHRQQAGHRAAGRRGPVHGTRAGGQTRAWAALACLAGSARSPLTASAASRRDGHQPPTLHSMPTPPPPLHPLLPARWSSTSPTSSGT